MKISIFWHRRDLRLFDNAGLYHALSGPDPVLPLFIFDRHILDALEDKDDARVSFIHQHIKALEEQLRQMESQLLVCYGNPLDIWKDIVANFDIAAVFTNQDYEPYARSRDAAIAALLKENGIAWHSIKDQCLRGPEEVLKDDGKPYTVFTPYAKKWRKTAPQELFNSFDNLSASTNFYKKKYEEKFSVPTLQEMGFQPSSLIAFPAKQVPDDRLARYADLRDLPGREGTTRLSVHLRFGTISVRQLARQAKDLSDTFINELIWRDFYMMILWHFPHVAQEAFRPEYDFIAWQNDESAFMSWCAGQTGYPMVDAGMRQLNQTGYMHNRVRMVVASFLTKHLLIDWRWGEAYFAQKLLDFELSSNNGGWQWAAGSGCDAAPYFRVFNPTAQLKKFDPDLKYVKKWISEYGDFSYPAPIVDHAYARQRALDTYKAGLTKGKAALAGM
ncbi:MAG: cryptochrome/photolyase family protein [Bernardetiaceae bacterium]